MYSTRLYKRRRRGKNSDRFAKDAYDGPLFFLKKKIQELTRHSGRTFSQQANKTGKGNVVDKVVGLPARTTDALARGEATNQGTVACRHELAI